MRYWNFSNGTRRHKLMQI